MIEANGDFGAEAVWQGGVRQKRGMTSEAKLWAGNGAEANESRNRHIGCIGCGSSVITGHLLVKRLCIGVGLGMNHPNENEDEDQIGFRWGWSVVSMCKKRAEENSL